MADLTDEELAEHLACWTPGSILHRLCTEVTRHRSARATDEERVRSVVREAVMDVCEHWRYEGKAVETAATLIATRAAKQLAVAVVRLDLTEGELQVIQWLIDDAPATHRGDLIRRVCRRVLLATRSAP